MKRCSETAYSVCAFAKYCGTIDDAVFMDGSMCDKFNEEVERLQSSCLCRVIETVVALGTDLVDTVAEAFECVLPICLELVDCAKELKEIDDA